MKNFYNNKQLIFLQEGSKRILSKDQILVSCSHMTVTYKIYTTYQFTYFIDVFIQDVTKDPKIK